MSRLLEPGRRSDDAPHVARRPGPIESHRSRREISRVTGETAESNVAALQVVADPLSGVLEWRS